MIFFFVERLIYNDYINGYVDFGCDYVWKVLVYYNEWESDENKIMKWGLICSLIWCCRVYI